MTDMSHQRTAAKPRLVRPPTRIQRIYPYVHLVFAPPDAAWKRMRDLQGQLLAGNKAAQNAYLNTLAGALASLYTSPQTSLKRLWKPFIAYALSTW